MKTWNIAGFPIGSSLERLINDQKDRFFVDVLKDVWSEVKKIAPSQWAANDAYVKSFRTVYKDTIKTYIRRYEFIANNTNEVTNPFFPPRFDFSFTLSLKKTITVSSFSGNSMIQFSIDKASIYGAAKYNGVYKGVRVDKRKKS